MSIIEQKLSYVERERSTAAIWCQRLAFFAVPYLTIVLLGHRSGKIETIPTFWLLGIGVVLLLAALIAGARGFHQLWYRGAKGGLRSARGMTLATLLLLPFAYQGLQAFVLPPIHDISTDLDEPPQFDSAVDDRTESMNAIFDPTEITKQLQLRSYPRVSARRYPLDSTRVFRAVVAVMAANDWTILTSNTAQGEAAIDEEGSGLVAKPVTDAKGRPLRLPLPKKRPNKRTIVSSQSDGGPALTFETQQVSPIGRPESETDEEQDERYVEAVATSFLFGFESDVVVRLIEEEDGTLVDMRSSSRWGPHDLGANASRIISFMEDLDTALQGLGQGS